MNRRSLLALIPSAAAMMTLAACATSPTPATVANDVALIAAGYRGVLPQIGTLAGVTPAIVATAGHAIADLQAAAAAFAGADVTTEQSLVRRIEADVNAVVTALAGLSLPTPISTVVQAAQVLLPIVEIDVGLIAPSAATLGISGLTPAQARAVLAGAR